MAVYEWRATDERGRARRGECDAGGLAEAAEQLRGRGLVPLSVERADLEPGLRSSVTADSFTLFNRNLAEMTAIGLPLPNAVREIASGLRRGRFRKALERVEAGLREGRALDEAVGEVDGIFPPYYRWMLKAGAASGNLSSMLSAVARNNEGVQVARRALLEALIYPALIILAALALGAGALIGFVPFYRELSRVQGFEATGLALFLQGVDVAGWIGAAAGAGALLACLLAWFLRRTAAGERILRAVPLLGRILSHLRMARLLGALGVMLRSNVPLARALPVALGAAGSRELDRAAARLAAAATEGGGLGDSLALAPGVSPEVAAFLAVAERTGDAPLAAGQAAELLTEQALAESEMLFTILVPSALLAAGIVVGGLLLSVAVPYLRFVESLHP